jgi:hypothetical protein
MGAAVQPAAASLGWLPDQGLKSSIKLKLNDMNDQINQVMPSAGRVLVVIGIQQSGDPKPKN